jgi:hypothetical protein
MSGFRLMPAGDSGASPAFIGRRGRTMAFREALPHWKARFAETSSSFK